MAAYSYDSSLKSRRSDELINIWLIRPLAGLVVRGVYASPITPNQLTFAAIVAGIGAAFCIAFESTALMIAAAVLIELKDILDSADGQLARAKRLASRRGRFYDSLGDVVVDAALFAGIIVHFQYDPAVITLSIAGFVGMTLRVSYHVYYQVMYLHRRDAYELNRADETVTDADRTADPVTRVLQLMYLLVYGWQDRMMALLDRWSYLTNRETPSDRESMLLDRWYGDPAGLRISGAIGLGTELALLALCTMLRSIHLYLLLNLILMNGILVISILYRKYVLSRIILRPQG